MHYLLHLYKAKHCQFKASHLLQEITKTSISASIIGSSKSSPVPVKVLKHGLPLLDVGEQSSKLMDVNRPRLVRVEHVDHRPGIFSFNQFSNGIRGFILEFRKIFRICQRFKLSIDNPLNWCFRRFLLAKNFQ